MRFPTIVVATVALGAILAAAPSASAGVSGYTFTTISVPGSSDTGFFGLGINNLGQIVGDYDFGQYGFLYTRGNYSTFDVPGAIGTEPSAINDWGQIVGYYCCDSGGGAHGFLDTNRKFTNIDVPGTVGSTFPTGINDRDQIVGSFFNTSGEHAFLDTRGVFTIIDVPGALPGGTFAPFGINNTGQIVGSYYNGVSSYGRYGFLDTRGVFTSIDVPGSVFTETTGINDFGQIVGISCGGACTTAPGFLDTNGNFTFFNAPGAVYTFPEGINDLGQIIGFFTTAREISTVSSQRRHMASQR